MSGDIVIPSQKTNNTLTSPCRQPSSSNVAFEHRQDDDGGDNHTTTQWLCDYCQVVRFKTFENALAHEEKCSQRGKKNHPRSSILRSSSWDDASISSLPSLSRKEQQRQRRRHNSHQLTSNSIVKQGKKGWKLVSNKIMTDRMKSMKSVFSSKKRRKGRRNSTGYACVDDSSSVSTFGTSTSNKSHLLLRQSSLSLCRSTELTIACSSVTGGGSYDRDDDGDYSEFLRQLDNSFHLSLHTTTIDDFTTSLDDKASDHNNHSAHCQRSHTIDEIENDNSRHDDDGTGVSSPSLSSTTTPSNPPSFHDRPLRQKQWQSDAAHNDGLAPRSSPLDVSEHLRRITLTATPQDVRDLVTAPCSFLPMPPTMPTEGDCVESSDGLMSYYSQMGGCLLPDYYGSYVNTRLDDFRVEVGFDG